MTKQHRQKLVIKPAALKPRERQEFILLKSAILRQAAAIKSLKGALAGQKQLIHNIAHELKNPLTVLYGYTNLLMGSSSALPLETRSQLDAMERNLKQLSTLVDELLDGARLEAGKIKLQREDVSAADLAQEAVNDIRMEALKNEIDLNLNVRGAEGLAVYADAGRARQILLNLLTNAVKFTPRGGAVLLSLAPGDGCALFCVKDTGIGIPAQALPRLFERFYQAKEAFGSRAGLGLGLSICRGLVELHGGKIWAESEPGSGSSFFFTLPLKLSRAGKGRIEARGAAERR